MDAGAAGRRDQEDTLIGPRDEREDVKASCKPMNIREAYELCTESTLTCLDAKLAIITQPPTVQQDLIVALCQQKVLKEKKFFGMTASLPNCMQGVSLWPLFGLSPPNLLLLSPSGNYYACVCEASPPPASKSPSKGASSSSPSSSSTPEYKVVLYGRTAAHIGGVVGVCTPKGSMPWHGSIGGGEFCPSQENLFVYVGEACTEDKKRRAKSLLAESLEEGKKKKAHAGEEQQEDDKLHKSKKKEEKEGDRHTQDSDGDEDQEEKEEINKFDESLDAFVYKTDMGEQLQGHREGRLFLTNFHRRTTHMLQPPNPNYSCGQPRWIPDGSGIACTMWDIHPYCLGLIYCINRRSRVYLAQQFGKKEEKEREGHEEEERKREDGEEQEEGIGEKKQEEEGEEEKHCKRKNRHDKKKDKKKKKSDLSCDWLQISKEEEDFAAFSPVWRDNLPRETKTTRRRGREGEQGREEEEGNVARVAYLSLRKHTEDLKPHMGGVCVKAVTLKRENRDSPWRIACRQILSEPLDINPVPDGRGVPYSGVYTAKLAPWVHQDVLFVNTFIGPSQAVVILDAHGGGCIGQICLELGALTVTSVKKTSRVLAESSSSPISLRLHDVSTNWLLLEASSLRHPPRLLLAKISITKGQAKRKEKDAERVGDEGEEEEKEKESEGKEDKERSLHPSVEIDLIGSICLGGSSDPQVAFPWSPYARLRKHLDRLETSLFDGSRHPLLRWKDSPRKDGNRSLAVLVHGGPHAVFPCVFSPEVTFLSLLGFDVLGVNYRGSLGFGQKELLSLLGKAGEQDVTDVAAAVEKFIESNREEYDESRTVIVGGSHGGFLTCHLIGQRPKLFAAASTRNPVTNLASMLSASDIPDWCFAEGLNIDFPSTLDLSEAQVIALCKASPIWNMRYIRTPLLLGIGGSDKRVPPFQGIDFYKRLLSRGVPARLLYYPEAAHPIEQPQYAENYWLNTALWFLRPTGGLDALRSDIFTGIL